MGFVRFLIGVVMLPLCVIITRTLAMVLLSVQPESVSAIPAAAWALGGGFSLWILVYFTLPRPVRTYVLAHELTHALWGALMGASVSKLRVSKARGSVTLSKTNVWITLAPYFFPLYTVMIVIAYYIASLFFNVRGYELLWLGLVGFTWGFHFTFTLSALAQHQSDVREYGHLFSLAMIYLLNVAGICLWVVLVCPVTVEELLTRAAHEAAVVAAALWRAGSAAVAAFRQ